MSEILRKELQIQGEKARTISLDVQYNSRNKSATPILFCHGFKGFKDWGCNNLIADQFAQANYFFIKLNFSLNGVIPNNLSDISDPEAFGQNNFTAELEDIKSVIDWLSGEDCELSEYFNIDELVAIGHSRGGSMVLISAIEDARIKKIICWAPVLDLSKYAELKDPIDWQEEPAMILNGRTGEHYPVYYQFYEDFLEHENRYDLQAHVAKIDKPLFIAHGTADTAVPLSHSTSLYEFVGHSLFVQVEGAGHTFGAKHPWDEDKLPEQLKDLIEECVEFLEM